MALVDYATYQRLTRDRTTPQPAVAALVADATQLLGERLGRFLEQGTYTERLRIYYDQLTTSVFGPVGSVYPSATPVASVSAPDGAKVAGDGVTIQNATPDSDPVGLFNPEGLDRYCTVTYVGGYTADTVPMTLARAIARMAAMAVAAPVPGGAVVKAHARSVDDVSETITYDTALANLVIDPVTDRMVQAYRKRRV